MIGPTAAATVRPDRSRSTTAGPTPAASAALEPGRGPGRGGEDDGVDLARGDGPDRRVERGRVRRRAPAVDDEAAHARARGGERLVQTVGAGAVVLDGDASAPARRRRAAPRRSRRTSRTPRPSRPADRRPGWRRGPSVRGRRSGRARSTAVSGSASPTASAASIQPRNPMPVVTTTMSGGSARSSRVAAIRRASSSLRDHAQRRRVPDHRAAALEGGAELGRAAVRGHEDHAPRHGLGDGLAHEVIVSRACGGAVTGPPGGTGSTGHVAEHGIRRHRRLAQQLRGGHVARRR